MLYTHRIIFVLLLCTCLPCFSKNKEGGFWHSSVSRNESNVSIIYYRSFNDYKSDKGIFGLATVKETLAKRRKDKIPDYQFTLLQDPTNTFLQDSVFVIKYEGKYYINKRKLHRGKAVFSGNYSRIYMGQAGELFFAANYIEQASYSYSWHYAMNETGGLYKVLDKATEECSWKALYVYAGEQKSALLINSNLLMRRLQEYPKLLEKYKKVRNTYKQRHRATVMLPLLQEAGAINID